MRTRTTSAWIACCVAFTMAACPDESGPPPDGKVDGHTDGGRDGREPDGLIKCSLSIATINGGSLASITKLTGGDDQDDTRPGIQIDVEVRGLNLADGVDVGLSVTDLTPDPKQKAASGKVTFQDVTVSGDLTTVAILAYATGCNSASVQLPVEPSPECIFVAPQDGTKLGTVHDKNPGDQKYTYDVKVETNNASAGTVSLFVDGTKQTDSTVGSTGLVVFADAELPPNKTGVLLRADVVVGQVTRSCQAVVDVVTTAPACSIKGFTPEPVDVPAPVGPTQGLGKAQDVNSATAEVETHIEVETGALVDQVTIVVDGVPGTMVAATGGVATFDAVQLTDGTHTIKFKCLESSTLNQSESVSASVLVDSKVPAAVTNLACAVEDNRAGEVRCNWTAVADATPSPSGMQLYQVRYTVGTPLIEASWATATPLGDVTAFPAGQAQAVLAQALPLAKTYYFGIKAVDYVRNTSTLAVFTDGVAVDFTQQERSIASASKLGAVMATGDFNCDGHTDVALGSPEENSNRGMVWIYLGNDNGVLGAPEKNIKGTVDNARFGSRLVALPNFNNDSDDGHPCTDLAVYASHGGTSQARVYVYLGLNLFFDREDVTVGKGADVIYKLGPGATSTEILGPGVASAGTFDEDDATDLALTYSDTGAADSATLLVVYGNPALQKMDTGLSPVEVTLPDAAGVRITGGKPSQSFGQTMACGALLDSDDYSDLVVGAKSAPSGGAVYVVRGGARAGTLPEVLPLTDARVTKIVGGGANTAFGSSIAFVGDMEQDGTPEFAVGDPTVATNTGQVYIFNLETTPATVADAVATVTNNVAGATGDRFGAVLGCAANFGPKTGADLNGDGYADLLVGSETMGTTGRGAVFEFSGKASLTGLSTSQASYTFLPPTGAAAGASFGASVVMAKDIDLDGYVDVIIGDPQHNTGQGRIFIYY